MSNLKKVFFTIQTKERTINAMINASVENGKVTIFDEEKRNAMFGNGDHIINLTSTDGYITVETK